VRNFQKYKTSIRIFSTTHSTFVEFVMELEQLRAAFELQLEEFVSPLIKGYRGDVDYPSTVLLGSRRTRNSIFCSMSINAASVCLKPILPHSFSFLRILLDYSIFPIWKDKNVVP